MATELSQATSILWVIPPKVGGAAAVITLIAGLELAEVLARLVALTL